MKNLIARLNYILLFLSLGSLLVKPKQIVTYISDTTSHVNAHKFIAIFSCLDMNTADPFASDPEDIVEKYVLFNNQE